MRAVTRAAGDIARKSRIRRTISTAATAGGIDDAAAGIDDAAGGTAGIAGVLADELDGLRRGTSAVFDLRTRVIGCEGAALVAEAAASAPAPTLRTLRMRQIGIGPEGAAARRDSAHTISDRTLRCPGA